MPFTSLVEIEDFHFVPDPEKYSNNIWWFLQNYPVSPPQMVPSSPKDVLLMLYSDHVFRQLVPLLTLSYYRVDEPSLIKGGLFLPFQQIYLAVEGRKDVDFGFRAPADPIANRLVKYFFWKKWGNCEKPRLASLKFVPGDNELAAGFKGPRSEAYRIFFPEKRGKRSYFAFMLLYVLTKRLNLSMPPAVFNRPQEHSNYVDASIFLNPYSPETYEKVRPALQEGLERMWYYNLGYSLFAPSDVLVLHGPQGDITLLGASIADPDSFWVQLEGDLLSFCLRWDPGKTDNRSY